MASRAQPNCEYCGVAETVSHIRSRVHREALDRDIRYKRTHIPSDVSLPMNSNQFTVKVVADRKFIGAKSEALVVADLLDREYTVLMPVMGLNPRYDLIAERAGKMLRVQVKTAPDHGNINFQGRYIGGEFDVIAFCHRDGSIMYADASDIPYTAKYFQLSTIRAIEL